MKTIKQNVNAQMVQMQQLLEMKMQPNIVKDAQKLMLMPLQLLDSCMLLKNKLEFQ